MSENFSPYPRAYDRELNLPEWNIQGSSITSYLDEFLQFDADNFIPGMLEYLRKQETPVILDLMSGTDALSTLHRKLYREEKKVIKALAVGLVQDIEPNRKLSNESLGIQAMEGDLNSLHTWKQIRKWLGKDKVHVIFERAYGGLHYVPTTPDFYRKAAGWLWHMLDPNGGVMLMQVPPFEVMEQRGIPINNWLCELQNAGIYHQALPVADWGHDTISYGFLMLRRNPEAPVLPDIV